MRARNLKPSFFTNADLVECEPMARILFAGLWCMADREGRLQDRPKQIKIQVLPCDSCDVDNLLSQLASKGLIIRYESGGVAFIQVTNFTKHQRPHVKEAESVIPEPPDNKEEYKQHLPRSVQAPTFDVRAGENCPSSLNTSSLIPESNTPYIPLTGEVDAGKSKEVFVLPDFIPVEPWNAFLEVRKKLRAANTPRALNMLVQRITDFMAKGHDPTAILENSIVNSWKGVFEPKGNQNGIRTEKRTAHDNFAEGALAWAVEQQQRRLVRE